MKLKDDREVFEMEIVTKKTSLNMNRITDQKTENFVIESDTIIPDIKPDILNTIATSGTVCIYKRELNNQKLRFDGTVQTYIMYLADEENGRVRGLQTNLDFSEGMDFEQTGKNASAEIDVRVKNMECKILNGRKIHVKAVLEVSATIYQNENVEVIEQLNEEANIQKMTMPTKISSLVGEGNTKIFAKDTFVIDNTDDLAEILKVEVKLVNRDYKVSYHKVLLKSDLIIRILYLTEDKRMKSIENRIPVMGFVDMPDVKEEDFCDVRYEMRNVLIKPNPVEEHSIYAECEIEAELRMYHNAEVDLIQDIYSTEKRLTFQSKTIRVAERTEPIKENFVIQEKQRMDELVNKTIYDARVTPRLNETEKVNGKIQYIGEVEVEFIFEGDNSSNVDTKRIVLPFDYTIENSQIDTTSKMRTNIEILTDQFVVEPDDQISIKIELEFTVEVSNQTELNLLDAIEMSEEELDRHGMVIYFVKPKDTLWEIAKRFCSTVDEIKRVNQIEQERNLPVRTKTIYSKLC